MFPLATYDFVPTDQLLYQSQVWQSDLSLEQTKDPADFLGDEVDFAMDINQEPGRIAEKDLENLDEQHIDHVINPSTSHGLPLPPNDFQPFNRENHSRS